jgi:hypothetical protein
MSILRILFGVLLGVCLLFGFLKFGIRFPGVMAFILCSFIGGKILFYPLCGLMTGRIGYYNRSENPIEFWFWVTFCSFMGCFFVGTGVYYFLYPH